MGQYYENSVIPAPLRRNFDVYERLANLGIELGSFEENVKSVAGRNIASVVFHESGLTYLSGVGLGDGHVSDDPEGVARGRSAGQSCADHHIRVLHWAICCGQEGGTLNDILYTVKVLGMVVASDVQFRSAPAVVNGYSSRWQSVFGGGIGDYASAGVDPGGFAGVHARSAIGGLTGRFSQEPEIIVALPSELSKAIISNRGWLFPLAPTMYTRLHLQRPT
jgi:hypothetical protein